MSYESKLRNPHFPLGPVLALAAGVVVSAYGDAMAAESSQALSCALPDAPAAVVSAIVAEYPETAIFQQASGEVVVAIHLAENGDVQSANIATSSHNFALDREALRVTRKTHFAPEIVNCKAVNGDYFYVVDFGT